MDISKKIDRPMDRRKRFRIFGQPRKIAFPVLSKAWSVNAAIAINEAMIYARGKFQIGARVIVCVRAGDVRSITPMSVRQSEIGSRGRSSRLHWGCLIIGYWWIVENFISTR
jgi:hypothetical protein